LRSFGGEASVQIRFKFVATQAAQSVLALGVANAADMPRPNSIYTAQAPISAYSWTGPYLGGNLGYQWGRTTRSPSQPTGIAGGVQGGYNWQTGQFVFGTEADIMRSAANDRFAGWKFSNPWFGTLRGRAGFTFGRVMLYGTLGLAFGGGTAEVTGATNRRTHWGWTTGAGMEFAVNTNWSARIEYLYVDLSDRHYTVTGASHGLESSFLRFGISYRF
jgi:outer membrane immunogenic protein